MIWFIPLLFVTGSLRASGIDSVHYELPVTMVNATRSERIASELPYAISVIEIDTFSAQSTNVSIEEILGGVPGLFVNNRNNLSQGDRISVRGLGVRSQFGVRGMKILLDDIPLTTADGQTQLNNIDLSQIGSVEIIRGPASVLYGNSSGGVISIKTRQQQDNRFHFAPRFLMAEDGLKRLQFNLAVTGKTHNISTGAYFVVSDGYREHAFAKQRGMNSSYTNRISSNLEFRLLLNIFDSPYMYNPSSLDISTSQQNPRAVRAYVMSQGAAKQVRQFQIGGVVKFMADEGSVSQLVIYVLDRKLLNPIPSRIIELDRLGGGFRATHRGYWKRLTYLIGIDSEWQHDMRDELVNEGLPDSLIGSFNDSRVFSYVRYGNFQLSQKEKVRGVGTFFTLEGSLTKTINVSSGARYDRYGYRLVDRMFEDGNDSSRRDLGQWSQLFTLSYRPNKRLVVYANYTTSFQNPTMNELSNRPDGLSGFDSNLSSERVFSIELGGRTAFSVLPITFDWSLYKLNLEDMLVPFQTEDSNSEEVFFRNIGSSVNQGFESSLQYTPVESIDLSVTYTFSNFKFVDYTLGDVQLGGNRVPGLPPHMAHVSLTFHPLNKSFIIAECDLMDGYFVNDFNGPIYDGSDAKNEYRNAAYNCFDLRMGFQIGSKTIFTGIENVFATRYNGSIVPNASRKRFFEPAAGRGVFAGIQWDSITRR